VVSSSIKSLIILSHACNPKYSGGRDQEDGGSKPDQANSSVRPYLEKTLYKKGLVVALSSSPSTAKEKKKKVL
jgi:hypothetical protein